MARLRSNNIKGLISDNPLTDSATTINSAGFADLPVVSNPDTLILILDPGELDGAAEIVIVTAHTSSATSVTATRGAESSSARQHSQNTRWVHGATVLDFDHGNLTGLSDDDHTQYIPKSIVDAKGDVIAATAADTVARLAVGTNNLVLTAASGEATGLKWVAPGKLRRIVSFLTGSGTYTPTSGTTAIVVECIGGGGGGGGVDGGVTGAAAGGGGGGGAYGCSVIDGPAASYAYAVGAGGTAGGTGTAGGAGGSTTFGSTIITAPGGSGGAGDTASTSVTPVAGGAGGNIATGADINLVGAPGSHAWRDGTNLTGWAGSGGGGLNGGGGGRITVNGSAAGQAGRSIGAGGSGALAVSNADNNGGAGKDGGVIIYEFE